MDTKAMDARIDAAAARAKELTARLDQASSEVARKLDGAIATAHDAAAQAAKKSEHRLGENLDRLTHQLQESIVKLAHRAEEVADELSEHARRLARSVEKSAHGPSEPGSPAR